MKSIALLLLIAICCTVPAWGQSGDEDIAEIIDQLTVRWDAQAEGLMKYENLKNLCRNRDYRYDLIELLDKIHHYDTTLYFVVTKKFETDQDPEAKATIDDIITLEADYTTLNFKNFIHQECNNYNMVENSFGKEGPEYEEERNLVEEELSAYVTTITRRIDIIDEHVHHLKL
ncbi:MAG: hypothetical protein RJQ09_09410 [Cyclobacteriaceae bacterium]